MATDTGNLRMDEDQVGKVRFGRNRMLAAASGFLFGTVATLSKRADLAMGTCGPPDPCYGFGLCCCCSGSTCCEGGCHRIATCFDYPYNPNHYCWQYCNANHNLFQCCDWETNQPCICRQIIGGC